MSAKFFLTAFFSWPAQNTGVDVLTPYSFTDAALASVNAAMSIKNVTGEIFARSACQHELNHFMVDLR